MKEKQTEESLEDVDVSFEVERKSDAGIAKNIISDDDSDETDESYVPDSLRDFLKAADKQLEEDLSFLSPPAQVTKNVLSGVDEVVLGGYIEEDNSMIDENDNNDLEAEMEEARQKDLERASAMKKEAEDRKEREQKQVDQNELEAERKQKQRKLEEAAKLEASRALEEDDDDDDDDAQMPSPLLDIVNPSADVTESHVKKIAMEGADHEMEEEAEALQPLVAQMPSPTIDNDMAALAKGEQGFSPSPNKVGRKLQMELDAEAQRASLTPNNKNNVSIDSVKTALAEKQKSMREKQQRLKELQARSTERKRRLQILDDKAAESNSVEVVLAGGKSPSHLVQPHEFQLDQSEENPTPSHAASPSRLVRPHEFQLDPPPSNAAVAAANQAAAVVANKPNAKLPDKVSSPTKPLKPTPRKLDLTGPVKSLPTHQRRRPAAPTSNQKWSFRARNAPSPPRPREIITHANFSQDGRSVSPLGHEQAVSPLASPQTGRNAASFRRPAPARNYAAETKKPLRPSPSRRRQLTRPSSAFDRLSRPTAASSGGRDTRRTQQQHQQTKSNPEEEQKKARERIRKRMAAQRRTKSSNTDEKTAAKKEAEARKEKIKKMEEERLAKIKAKIAAREKRIQIKKKEEPKKTKPRLQPKTTTAAAPPQQVNKPQTGAEAILVFTTSENNPNRPKPFTTTAQKKAPRPKSKPSQPALTIPVAPKFATDRRSTGKKAPPKERLSLASSASRFGKGLRSSTPPVKRSATPEPRRLTIPMAPKFATSARLGDKQPKSTPFSSPTRRGRDDASWSSQLRDVSAIGSPLSKAASSVKTGPLTIPLTPNFQPIRKRPLPKSTAEREKEEMEYFKEHPFKARMVKMHEPLTVSRKNPTPKRKLTTPEPFQFHTTSSTHKRGYVEAKEEEEEAVTSFKATPMPNFSSKKATGVKKTPYQARPLTTPEPFKFNSTISKRNYVKSEDEPSAEKFKAKPMPNFKKANRASLGSRVASPRSLTTPEPFRFNSTIGGKRSYTKSEEEATEAKFKALPMPDFKKSNRASLGSKKLKSPPTRPLTTPEPFRFGHSRRREENNTDAETDKAFKARPMPNFSKTPVAEQVRSKNKKSNKIPTGASGLMFHRSFTASSRLSRPRVAKEPPKQRNKPFKARPMPDFIPDVIITKTPIKQDEPKDYDRQPYELEQDLDNELEGILSDGKQFQARPMPDFDKVDIPVRENLPHRIRTPSPGSKKSNERLSSPGFKASPAPKNMLDEPKIPVRRRDPKKLRSPDSVKRPATTEPEVPKSPVFKALPIPDSLYDEPTPIRRSDGSPIRRKIKSPDRFKPSPQKKLGSPVTSPPRINREVNGSNNVMEDAKARLRERLSKRRTNSAAVKAVTPNRDKAKADQSTPMAFSTLRVQSRLNAQANKTEPVFLRKDSAENPTAGTENTPRKSNTAVPKSIDLPVRSPIPNAAETPKASNNNSSSSKNEDRGESPSSFHTAEDADGFGTNAAPLQQQPVRDKEAALLRETKLALALGIPDGDESSSILQLARDVQKAAEDELSFYGSVDTRDHWSSSLADGKPQSLLD